MYKNINLNKFSEDIFFLGIFFLASAMSIGSILILISSFISLGCYKEKLIKDKWSVALIIISIFMLVSCFVQTISYLDQDLYGWNISLTWLGLLNWIPFFYLFITTKSFLETSSQRLKVSILLFSGSIPVLITGLGQYFFNWQGPLSFSNGLIVWYLKDIEPHLGLSGLFSNQNYTGAWLSVIWPFSLSFIFLNRKNNFKKSISILLLLTTTLAIILTTSRNALSGVLISIPIIFGLKSLIIIFIIFTFIFILFLLGKYIPLASSLFNLILSILPIQFINKFSKISFLNILEIRRINLWNDSINLIASRPIFGLGAAFFPILYAIKYEPIHYTEQHTHNLFLELAASYGFLVSITFSIFIFYLLVSSWKSLDKEIKLNYDDVLINKTWFASSVIIITSQMTDITYYDGRISMVFWILLSGLRNISLFNNRN
tara:strand:- start:521 stop:1813 length:1293 start_codon:yes stop_codon:yes gene_type:complete